MVVARVREATRADVPGILELQHRCYPLLATVSYWRAEHIEAQLANFPEGQFVADIGRRLVGYSASFMTRSGVALRPHDFRTITARGTFNSHEPGGDVLYGAEIMVDPDLRRLGIGRRFYKRRFDLVRRRGLRYFVAGGRLPGYKDYRQRMTVEEYVDAVVRGELSDRVLSVQIKIGLRVKAILPGYLTDPNSANFATLLVWENPGWSPGPPPRRVRAGRSKGSSLRVK